MKYWVLIDNDGAIHQVMSLVKPTAATGYDVNAYTFIGEVPRMGNLVNEKLNETQTDWVCNVESLRQSRITEVNAEREARSSGVLTKGGVKRLVYAQKAAEVRDYPMGSHPFAEAQSQLTGQSVPEVIAEFAAGAANSFFEVARIEAVARCAIQKIKAATTAEEINAPIDWEWEPD
jgi:hypothetical protein